jgi:hypothetical protein
MVNHLNQMSVKKLHDAPDNVDDKKPTQRLLAVIAYKKVFETELTEWYYL